VEWTIKPLSYTAKTTPQRGAVFIGAALLTLVIGFLEYLSGYELTLSILHLIPVSIVVLFIGPAAGAVLSVYASLVWYFADLLSGHSYSSAMIPVFNTTVRLGYFILHTVLLARMIAMYRAARNQSLVDPLTEIGNWRFFSEILHREVEKARRSTLPLALVYIDLDNFKEMNDSHGHSSGDDLLRLFARTVSSLIRPADVMARLGGDEFALLFPETDAADARSIIERMRGDVLELFGRRRWPVSLSIGVMIYRRHDLTIEEMVKKADALMYRVKNGGKNGVEYSQYPGGNGADRL
jgi:diguanylate cyclase (GGDEF)-like protein